KIFDRSGLLFNTQGYKATSISDITRATGYTKGAIYRHFRNKDALEKETLQHLSSKMFTILSGRIKSAETAGEKLRSIVTYFETYITRPGVKGGCPLMNAAIEADDAHPVLRRTAVRILDTLHSSVTHILNNGIRFKQIKKNIDVDFY